MRIQLYKTLPHESEHHSIWRDVIGVALSQEIARILFEDYGETVVQDETIVQPGGGSFKVEHEADIAFVPYSWYPDKRPAKFIYTFASDVRGYEVKMQWWQDFVRPNYIGCLQDLPQWMIEWGDGNFCEVELAPWFVVPTLRADLMRTKITTGLISGAIGQTYPSRTKMYEYLKSLNRPDVILSCGAFGKYPLTTEQYKDVLHISKYYLSGGIYDEFIPPKYYEAANYGCCIISEHMSRMTECGFVDGETYIAIESVDEIEDILESRNWYHIGLNARSMVKEKHSVHARAKRIVEVYKNEKS